MALNRPRRNHLQFELGQLVVLGHFLVELLGILRGESKVVALAQFAQGRVVDGFGLPGHFQRLLLKLGVFVYRLAKGFKVLVHGIFLKYFEY